MWSLLLPARCGGCGAPGGALCPRCRRELAALAAAGPAGAHGIAAAVPFVGVGRALVTGLKFRNQRALAEPLAELLAQRVAAEAVASTLQVVTWAPTSSARRRRRGVDQAELVARRLARQIGLPCRPLLRRLAGQPQTGRSRAERLSGPRFVARPLPTGCRVLVVDDVVTTGATLRAAGAALQRAGAALVLAVAVAATP
jgi:predicted amidophosphoribosyltransferase